MSKMSDNAAAPDLEAVEAKTDEVVITATDEQTEDSATDEQPVDPATNEQENNPATTTAQPEKCSQDADQCATTECKFGLFVGIAIVAVIILLVIASIIKSKKKAANNKGKKKSFKSNPNAVEIYVGNLSYEMNNSELRKEFEKFGIVTSARIITQRNSRKSKGYGFVEMPHRSEAEEAIRALNNKEIKGRKIHVNEARANTRRDNH